MITTTLNEIRSFNPCRDGWGDVFKAHKHLGLDTKFPVSSILDSNDIDDTLWVLNRKPETLTILLNFSLWCTKQVEHLLQDPRSKGALVVLDKYLNGEVSGKELEEANTNADAAAHAAANAVADAANAASAYAASAYAAVANAVAAVANAYVDAHVASAYAAVANAVAAVANAYVADTYVAAAAIDAAYATTAYKSMRLKQAEKLRELLN